MAVIIPGKLVYLATPHTGSIATTVALAGLPGSLSSEIGHGLTIVLKQREGVLPKVPHHSTIDQLRELVGDKLTGAETSFTTIRNPYDLLVTCWLRHRARLKIDFLAYLKLSLVDEVRAGPYVREGRLFWHEASRYLRYENLQEELSSLLRDLSLDDVQLPRRNVTPDKQPWRTYYDESTRQFAQENFGGGAARFGYSFNEAAAASS